MSDFIRLDGCLLLHGGAGPSSMVNYARYVGFWCAVLCPQDMYFMFHISEFVELCGSIRVSMVDYARYVGVLI